MSYPQLTDYQEALQHPSSVFYDPVLKAGVVETTPMGLPFARSGGIALTYTVEVGSKKYAVRCFHKELPNVSDRYRAIAKKLKSLQSPYFVDFEFQERGIHLNGQVFPIVKMDWATGKTLGVFLDHNAFDAGKMSELRAAFFQLAQYLEINGVAHGDISNENVIVENGSIKLIDYDGMFVPDMQVGRGAEIGMKHFQHPSRQVTDFGPHVDRFSFIVVDLSLQALVVDSSLHKRFREGGQTILFKANDFLDPMESPIFKTLLAIPELRDSASRLASICSNPLSKIPSLADFRAGINVPSNVGNARRAASQPSYVGAYKVVDATSYSSVVAHVGETIELVGKIISVKSGVTRRGKLKGRPFVFINFGVWNKESVKITIWAEGLSELTNAPDKSWEGRYISAIGLIDPPFEGSHYGRPYRNVGMNINSDSQLVHLTQAEAQFRLRAKLSQTLPPRVDTISNRSLLESLTNTKEKSNSFPQPTKIPMSPNAKILSEIHQNQSVKGSPVSNTKPTMSSSNQASVNKSDSSTKTTHTVPAWVWVLAVCCILLVFMSISK